jgi:ATP-dependent DNA helicase RecQ
LIRLGYVRQAAEKYSVLELTAEGRAVLRSRPKIVLTTPVTAPAAPEKRPRAGEIACDEALFEQLRRLRKQLADQQNLPAYIVFSDVALRQMARHYPASQGEFMRISGVGEKKLAEYGAAFLGEISSFLQTNPRQIFADDSFTVSRLPGP